MAIDWQWKKFEALELQELYEIFKLRQAVFVVEQNCVYQDADGLDQDAWHLSGWQHDANGEKTLLAYMRVISPGHHYDEPSMGRVLVDKQQRDSGLGKELLRRGLLASHKEYPGQGIRISAQLYLENFYQGFGFETVSLPYDEDGIAHVQMLKA